MYEKQRRVVTRSGRGVRGYFPSTKAKRSIPFESLLERDAILLFEFTPAVITYREYQQREIYYDGTKPRDYYPDFLLELSNERSVLVEVKPYSELQRPRIKTKFAAIAQHFHHVNRWFRILTDQEIRRQPYLDNLTRLAYYKRQFSYESLHVLALERLRQEQPVPLRKCVDDFGGERVVLCLIANEVLRVDMNKHLTSETPVYINEGGHQNDAIQF